MTWKYEYGRDARKGNSFRRSWCRTVSVLAEDGQSIVINGGNCFQLVAAPISTGEDVPVTVHLDSDVPLTAAGIIGSGDCDGAFDGWTMTVASHDSVIDLNGHTLNRAEGSAVLEVGEQRRMLLRCAVRCGLCGSSGPGSGERHHRRRCG